MHATYSRVDAHIHFWHPARLNYPWLAAVPALNRPFLPEDYSLAARTADIGKMVFVECGCLGPQSPDEVAWITELAANEPRLHGIVAQAGVEFGSRINGTLAAFAQNPLVKGVRRNLQGEMDGRFCLQSDFITGVRALANFNFTFDLCLNHHQLSAVIELVRRCPEVFFVLDHCAKPPIRAQQLDPWRQNLRELADLPNVACKISGLVTEADPAHCGAEALRPYVAHAVDCFGFDRVLFGTDWPLCELATPLENWLANLKTIFAGETEANLTKFFQTNAERIYRV